jgi:excisionase family DNA binding protein
MTLNELFGRNSFISVKELASYLRLTPECLYEHIRAGKLEALALGEKKKTYRIPRDAVERFLDTLKNN